ncbi:OmpA family protein [Catelliglobosispora koreensis]|uniref:OmpA family protein n=1 Tax=Catelliglobosispora koreensis TaxID=129052 RepID=UPI00035EE37F|nr:OmpA family protein [Catelliglobosispora koreensis]
MPSILRDSPGPGETIIRRAKTTTYTNGRGLLPWLLAALLVPLALAWLWLYPGGGRERIENDLSDKARGALSAAGFGGAGLAFNGADATVCGIAAGQEEAARAAVKSVSGINNVRVAAAGDTSCGPVGGGTNPTTAGSLAAEVRDNALVLNGIVPDEAAKAQLVQAATATAGGRAVVDNLTVQSGVQLPATAAEMGTVAGILAAVPGEHQLQWNGSTVTLTGTVPTEQDKANAEQMVKQAAPSATVDNQLTVSGAGGTVDKAALQQNIDAALRARPVTFEPDSATLTAQGNQTLEEIAPMLAAATGVAVRIEGHVAAVSSPVAGQELSEQRAQAVMQKLVDLGVPVGQLSAQGLGDSDPVADNNTAEGQALNRRVEITVQ